MKRRIFFIAAMSISACVFSQVGVNTTTPKSTFDITGKLGTADIDGLQAPRITRAELTGKGNALYGADQKGTFLYITDVTTGDNAGPRANITSSGYYFFDGTLWQKVVFGTVDNTDDAFINDPTSTAVKLGTNSDGTTARAAGANFVVQDNGNVGIGIASPSTKLHVESTTSPAVTITDGTEGTGRLLKSDANGVATWAFNHVIGSFPQNSQVSMTNLNTIYYTGASITVPPGKWIIHAGTSIETTDDSVITEDAQLWCHIYISDTNDPTVIPYVNDQIGEGGGLTGSGSLSRGEVLSMATGKFTVENTDTVPHTYYIMMDSQIYPPSALSLGIPQRIFTGFDNAYEGRWLYATSYSL